MEDNYSSRAVRARRRSEVAAVLSYVPVSYLFHSLSPGPPGPQVALWTCKAVAGGAGFVLAEYIAWIIDRSARARYAEHRIIRDLATDLGGFVAVVAFIAFSSLPAILIGAIDASSLLTTPIFITLLLPLIAVGDTLTRHFRRKPTGQG